MQLYTPIGEAKPTLAKTARTHNVLNAEWVEVSKWEQN